MNEMTIRGAEKQANLQKWSQRVAECRSSGLPVRQWCDENGVNPKAYYTWQKKVFDAIVERQDVQVPRFAQLRAPEHRGDPAATVRMGGAAVDVYAGADAATVSAIVKALTSC